jgi:ribonuclease T2
MSKDFWKKFIIVSLVIVLLLIIVFFIITSQNKNTKAVLTQSNTPIQTTAIPSLTPEPTATNIPNPTATPTAEVTPTEVTFIEYTLAEKIVGDFDYFIMALAWEPGFCASNNNPNTPPCTLGKTNLSFVLHGLWPVYNQGFPSYCSTEAMSYDLINEYPGVYPNDFLYTHEWEKHGTCTGLDPEEYISVSQQLKDSVIIPATFDSPEESFRINAGEIVKAFAQKNPDYSMDSFSAFCSEPEGLLLEIYVCYSKDGQPTGCGEEVLSVNNESCGQLDFLVLNPQ